MEIVTLSSGIPVLLAPQASKAAATYWWVRTGSADERPAEAGFAHFLEHMLFKDAGAKETGKGSSGRTARAIESLGGDINAYTSFDQTVYHVTCAELHWERVLDAFAPMARPARFLNADFKREREVILEELSKNQDSPSRMLWESVFRGSFRKHPYGKPVIGYPRTLNAAKVGTLEAFYRRRYAASRMGVILVGPLDDPKRRRALLARLEKNLGAKVYGKPKRAGAKPAAEAPRAREPELRAKAEVVVQEFDVQAPSFVLSYRAPDLRHADIPALEVLGGVLGSGELGRLHQNLFVKHQLATEASAGLYVPGDPGLFFAQAELSELGKLRAALDQIQAEFERIAAEGPTAVEIQRVITAVESEKRYATQSVDGLAGRVGFLHFVLGDPDHDQKFLAALRALTAADVQRVARQYLVPERLALVAQVPKGKAAEARAAIAGHPLVTVTAAPARTAASSRAKGRAPVAARLPVFGVTPRGVRFAHLHRPDSEVFSVYGSVLGGSRLEAAAPGPGLAGASYLMSMALTRGTRERSAQQVAAEVENRAAGIDGFSGRNSAGLQLTGLKRDFPALSALFTEVFHRPAFAAEEVEHVRRISLDSIRTLPDHSSQLCSHLFMDALYGAHPYGRLVYGDEASVRALSAEHLRALHAAWFRPERAAIAVSGPISADECAAFLDSFTDAAEPRRAVPGASSGTGAGAVAAGPPAFVAPDGPRWVERDLGREQVHLVVGASGLRLDDPRRFASRIMQAILGGQSGRLFIELREKRSLAYSVSPIAMEGLEPGYIGTYIGSGRDKKAESLKGIHSVLEHFAAKGPTAAEMRRAVEYTLGRRAMDLQGDASLAPWLGLDLLYGLPHRDDAEAARLYRRVTAREVRDLCREFLVDAPQVTACVG